MCYLLCAELYPSSHVGKCQMLYNSLKIHILLFIFLEISWHFKKGTDGIEPYRLHRLSFSRHSLVSREILPRTNHFRYTVHIFINVIYLLELIQTLALANLFFQYFRKK